MRAVRPRTLLLLLAVVLIVATPAAADLRDKKASIDGSLAAVQGKIAAARAREQQLQADVASTTERIRALELRVGDVATRLSALQEDLALRRQRLTGVDALLEAQTRQLRFLRRQQALAERRLARRVVEIYESNDPTAVEVALGASSLQDAIDRINAIEAINAQDRQTAEEVVSARQQLMVARRHTRRLRDRVRSEERIVSYRVAQAAAVRDELVGAQRTLLSARTSTQRDLAVTKENERDWQAEADALQGASASIAAQLAAAPTTRPASPPGQPHTPPTASGGLIWPVSGPITSPFGMRWGSLHPGIDIGVPMGTPIRAAAAGHVVLASYDGGYGNLVVIDHGNSLATAYAHQSAMAVTVGQFVEQGQVIGYVGSTGFSTGPHLHFEVRVNGTPVDPLGYL